MNFSKFFLCLLITGTPLFYVDAMQEQVQAEASLTKPATAAPLIKLAANAIARTVFNKKEDLFALLRTRYKDLPDERKADIITAYSEIAGLPLFDAYARWKQARLGPESLAKLAATCIAKAIYEKSGDLFALLKTTYKDLPNECKAGIIAAYSKLIPADQLLPLAIGCAQLSDLALFDEHAKQIIKRAALIEKNNPLKDKVDRVVSSVLVSARQELLKGKLLSEEKKQAINKLSFGLDKFLASVETGNAESYPLPAQWNVYLTGEANNPSITCILEADARSCVFARTALEITHRLAAHEFFDDQAEQQPLTRICLLEKQNHDNSFAVYQQQCSVELIKESLMALVPENDWIHSVQQLMVENEPLALDLLMKCLIMRMSSTTIKCFLEIYLWACIFDRHEIQKFIECVASVDSCKVTTLPIIKKLYGNSTIILVSEGKYNDAYFEKIKQKTLRRDLLAAAYRGDYEIVLHGYDNLEELKNKRVPYPLPPKGCCIKYDLLDFACKLGYTKFVEVLLAKGFEVKSPNYALMHVLTDGRKRLVRKIFNQEDTEKKIIFDAFKALEEIDKDKLGRSADALKIFIDCNMAASHVYRVFDFAQLFAAAAYWENREIFDYLLQAVKSEKCSLTVAQKQEMLGLALCLAVHNSASLGMIQLLVESGASVNGWPQESENPRHADDYQEAIEVTGHLLYDAVNRDEPYIPCDADIEVVRYLLSQGARDEAFECDGGEVSGYGLAHEKELDVLAELLRSVFVERQPMDEQPTDEPLGEEQP